MRTLLTREAKRTLLCAGYYARRLRADRFPGVAVLCYHGVRDDRWAAGTMVFEDLHVRAGELEAHCRLLRETCQPISLTDWRTALRNGSSLPARPVLVTFDDGYRTVFTLARPLLQRYGIPAAVFVCSQPVERRRLFWHDAVAQACGEPEVQRLKAAPFNQWQTSCEQYAREAAGDDPHAPLTAAEVRALAATAGIEIGAHTVAHPILARASRAEQREQIQRNKTVLEQWTGGAVTAFAYPNGRPEVDYTKDTVELVKESGFALAFTTRHGFAGTAEPALEHSRFLMLAGISAAELAHRLCHSWRR